MQPQNAFFGFDRSTFGPFTGFDQLAPDHRARLALDPEDIPAYADAVMGQLSPSTTRARFADARQLTLLREPRIRIVSHWLSWRAQNTFTMRGWGDWVGYARLARAPLHYVLDDPDAAVATDNMLIAARPDSTSRRNVTRPPSSSNNGPDSMRCSGTTSPPRPTSRAKRSPGSARACIEPSPSTTS